MLIAHFSDPHLCGLRSNWTQMRSEKQFLGALNWITRRGKLHKSIKVEEAILDVADRKPDLLLITGDISQLALECDYENLGVMLKPIHDAKIPTIIMRGNHDMYSQKPQILEAFSLLRNRMQGNLSPSHEGIYQLDEVTIAEVDAAVPTQLSDCNGEIHQKTVQAISSALSETDPNIPRICCCHFPILQSDGNPQPEHKSLHGRELLLDVLHQHHVQLYLCGHIHQPFTIGLGNGLIQYCAGSASAGGCLNYFQIDGKNLSLQSSTLL